MQDTEYIKSFTVKLFNLRKFPGYSLPDKIEVETFIKRLLILMFPHYGINKFVYQEEIENELLALEKKLCHIISPLSDGSAEMTAKLFFEQIPVIHDHLLLDAETIAKGDPAASNVDEVILAYPGFLAIAAYRIAHVFHQLQIPFFPRLITEYAHRLTGIDIHPAAEIGKAFFIDHGTGIVIGETSKIEDNVKIYQGVTLGALSVDKKLAKQKRHPTIENNCVIYSNATILGGETIIGKHSIIGGNVWLTASIPPYSIVYHKSEIRFGNVLQTNESISYEI